MKGQASKGVLETGNMNQQTKNKFKYTRLIKILMLTLHTLGCPKPIKGQRIKKPIYVV
jgi:hypothetical protein